MAETKAADCPQGSVIVGLDEYDMREDDERFCFECLGYGWIDCRCGGDTCCCRNNGDMPCPFCTGVLR